MQRSSVECPQMWADAIAQNPSSDGWLRLDYSSEAIACSACPGETVTLGMAHSFCNP